MKVSAIIVAAGRGTRMGPDVDKLFIEIAGRPVIAHTWRRFEEAACIDEVILVVRAGMESAFFQLANESGFRKPFKIVAGGKERQDSVWNGLQALSSNSEIVAIHDGARPCTDAGFIASVVAAARESGAAVAARRVTDTIKESEEGTFIARHLDRKRLWAVQTPQAFRVGIIRSGLEEARRGGLVLTDDTAACELIGRRVRLVESAAPNPKITSPSDVPFIEVLLRSN